MLGIITVPVTDLRAEPAPPASYYHQDALQESQLLYGEQVTIHEARDGWFRVTADEQPYYRDSWKGYPGWVKESHVTTIDAVSRKDLVVAVPWAALKNEEGAVVISLCMGTFLTCIAETNDAWIVSLPSHGDLKLSRQDAISTQEPFAKERLIDIGSALVGAPYHWGGCSCYHSEYSDTLTSVDCSGLVMILYRLAGVQTPRNAHDQFFAAIPCSYEEMEVGDLIFVKDSEKQRMTHVMLYAGGDRFLEATITTGRVQWDTGVNKFGVPLSACADNGEVYFGKINCL